MPSAAVVAHFLNDQVWGGGDDDDDDEIPPSADNLGENLSMGRRIIGYKQHVLRPLKSISPNS
jgi:hypothetical protein